MEIYTFRVAISQVTFNVLPLNNNLHRYSTSEHTKSCPFCRTKIENKQHFLFECLAYNDLREKFLQESARLPAHSSFHIHNVFRYVFHAVNRRKRIFMK